VRMASYGWCLGHYLPELSFGTHFFQDQGQLATSTSYCISEETKNRGKN
jgi:hypothetical protein